MQQQRAQEYDLSSFLTDGKQWNVSTLRSSDPDGSSGELRFGTYNASLHDTKKFLIFLNGRTEFIEKYAGLPLDLTLPQQCGFLTWDHRGHGASWGTPYHIGSYESYARDAQCIIDHQVSFATPYAILAHSMGCLIALYGAMKHYYKPRMLILSSPLLGIPNHPLPRFISRPLAFSMHGLGQAGRYINNDNYPREPFASNPLTHDQHKYERLQRCPFRARSITFGWLRATYQALDFVFSEQGLRQLDVPLYILAAEHESVVDPFAAKKFAEKAALFSKQPVVYQQIAAAKHELLYEEESLYRKALDHIGGWLNHRFLDR
jgi:lysophospholipase